MHTPQTRTIVWWRPREKRWGWVEWGNNVNIKFFKEKRMEENNRDTNKLAWHPILFWASNNHECKCQVEISFMVCFLVTLGTVRAKCVTVKPVTSPWVSSLPICISLCQFGCTFVLLKPIRSWQGVSV